MIRRYKNWILVAFLTLAGLVAISQQAESTKSENSKYPRWVSEMGYWVIESNTNSPSNHIIRFYNAGNILVYKETLTGVRLNPEKMKVKMKLKKILESSVLSWEKIKKSSEELAKVKSVL